MFYAHISEDGRKQTVLQHLEGTARLASEFAGVFGEEEMGRLIGLAHDIGKYTPGFQKRLHGGPKVDHSSAGAFEVMNLKQFPASFCIGGHHGGIPDGGGRGDSGEQGTLMGRLAKVRSGRVEDYTAFRKEIELPQVSLQNQIGKNLPADCFLIRLLFSCLVDADYLDTERFMDGEDCNQNKSGWSNPADMEELDKRLQKHISKWFPPQNDLNRLRCEILESCITRGEEERPGLFSLTVPTGGGKTVASLAFALRHAKAHGKRRIIYVIPYTSIIDQTADVFKKILGEENVLEHHSGIVYEDEGGTSKETIRKIKATENWDMPVIVTTAVQFFESLYSNKPSKCRKLHNIADSVIVLDEAQMLPIPYLRPCVHGIAQLVERYHVSAVLCTATQPALENIFKKYLPDYPTIELCPEEIRQNAIFRRVTYHKAGRLAWEEVGNALNEHHQVLCIVNSRKNANQLFQMLEGEGTFHLSTLMYPEHRRQILREIRKRLAEGERCKVVSTSLIEAGVDVDFPTVFREEAGLDSILQAAGRCNREGKRSKTESTVTVFQAENKPPQLFAIPIGATRSVLMHREDISSEEAIHEYFSELLDLKGENAQDKKQILKRMESGDFPFKSIAEDFKLIENDVKTVYIPNGENRDLISRLRQGERSRKLFRELGQYGVSVYKQHYEALYEAGDVEILDDNAVILTNDNLYSEKTGLSLEADFGKALFI
ncbi:MAG: CRISPR-associated helicase Cas3' [Lachnospiraceae bacterium]|nr:CRISPR-associated helicase Cas3' [Lachnospiraceae bacterium]